MAKRRTNEAGNRGYNADGNLDLTGAFAPVKGKQSVDYDTGDNQIGLTQAFGAVVVEEPPYGDNDEGKWNGYDWDSYKSPEGESDETEPVDEQLADQAGEGAFEAADGTGAGPKPAATGGRASSGRGRHAAPELEASPRMKRSRRTRRVLIVLIVLLVIAAIVAGYFMFKGFQESQQQAAQQAQEQVDPSKNSLGSSQADDAVETVVKLTDVPNLSEVLGKNTDDAVATLKRGATVIATNGAGDDEGAIKSNVTIQLSEEPTDSSGTPTVYLGLNEQGNAVQAGYSASAGALGFGSLSFADAVNNEHIIEKTLQKVGVEVPEGSAVLPENREEYSTFSTDGTTVTKERYSFSGDANVNGEQCAWSAVLAYDYTKQIYSGNLSDTVRTVYVYVTTPAATAAPEEAPAE